MSSSNGFPGWTSKPLSRLSHKPLPAVRTRTPARGLLRAPWQDASEWYNAGVRTIVPFAFLVLPFAGCVVEAITLEGKQCPCGGEYSCVDGRCTTLTTGGDAGQADGDEGGSGCAAPPSRQRPRLAAGSRHTCAIRGGGLWCWGDNEFGQLGTGDTQKRSYPTRVGTESDWVTVAAGSTHTCGIRGSEEWGYVYCWGDNDAGKLGLGSADADVPTSVSANIAFHWVSAGDSHTCGIDTDQQLWCWGRQQGGAVGLGNLSDQPMTTPAFVGQPDNLVRLMSGGNHSCVITGDSMLWCWGHAECYQTGTPTHPIVPTQVDQACWHEVAGGGVHSCGILANGTLVCFGFNEAGQLGMGSVGGGAANPIDGCFGFLEPQPVVGELHWKAVDAGMLHSCGIDDSGGLWCWGYNEQRQVADIADIHVPAPERAADGDQWVEVAAGFFHTCARTADDQIHCRGLDEHGQQGTGTYNPTMTPVTF